LIVGNIAAPEATLCLTERYFPRPQPIVKQQKTKIVQATKLCIS